MVSFSEQKNFNLDTVKFMDFFLFMNCAFDVKSKNSDQIWVLKNFSCVYSNSFKVLHLSPWSILVKFCIRRETSVWDSFLALPAPHRRPNVLASFIERFFPLLNCFCVSVKNQLIILLWVQPSVFPSSPVISECTGRLPTPQSLDCCNCIIRLKTDGLILLFLPLPTPNCFGYFGSFAFSDAFLNYFVYIYTKLSL